MYSNATARPRLDLAGPLMVEATKNLDIYVAHRLFAAMRVNKAKGDIPKLLATDNQVLAIKHAPKTPFARIQGQVTTASFDCQEAGVEEQLSAEDWELLGDRAEEIAALRGLGVVLRARDNALATALADETYFAGQITTGAAAWDNASGKPLDDLASAKDAVALRTGVVDPSLLTLTFSYGAYTKLKKNAQIQSSIRSILGINDRSAVFLDITPERLAEIFSVGRVLIAGGRKNTATEGQTASFSWLWDSTKAFLSVTARSDMDFETPAAGRMFVYDRQDVGSDAADGVADTLRSTVVETYREEQTSSDVVRAKEYVGMAIVNKEGHQIIKSI
jgi:hypothetical protein